MRAAYRFLSQYGVSLVAPALATLFTILLWPVSQRLPFALFIAAVIVSTWQGGQKPGMLTTALSACILGLVYWLQMPDNKVDTPAEYLLRLGMFVLVGVLAGYLCQQCKRAIAAMDHVHDVLSSSGFALIFTDAEGQVTHLNPQAESLTGWNQADAKETPLERVFSLVHGEALRPMPSPVADVVSRRSAQDLVDDTVLLAANGARIPIEGTAGPMRDAGDRVVGVVVAFRDASRRQHADGQRRQQDEANWQEARTALTREIEERAACQKEAEEALQKAQAQFAKQSEERSASQKQAEESLRQSRDALQKQIQELTSGQKRAEESLRTTRKEFEGQAQELEQKIKEKTAGQKRAEEALEKARKEFERRLEEARTQQKQPEESSRKAQAELQKELEERTRAQKQVEERLRKERENLEKQLEDLKAAHKTALTSLQTELSRHQDAGQAVRQNQERLQSLIEEMPALVSVKSREGRFLVVNRAFAAFVKRSAEHIVGKKTADLPARDGAVLSEATEHKVLESGALLSMEEEVPGENGPRTYLTSKFPLRDAAGDCYAVGSVSVDITERKQAEVKLRRDKELLEKRDDEKVLVSAGGRNGNDKTPISANRPAVKGYRTPDFQPTTPHARKEDDDWMGYN